MKLSNTYSPSALWAACLESALSAIPLAVWSYELLSLIWWETWRINFSHTWVSAPRTWDTCITQISFSMQACGSSRNGANQSASCSLAWATLRISSRQHSSSFRKRRGFSISKTSSSSPHSKTSTCRSIRRGYKCARRPLMMRPRKATSTIPWFKTYSEIWTRQGHSTDWMLILRSAISKQIKC